MKRNYFAMAQVAIGLISTLIVVVSYLTYRQPLEKATLRLDTMSQQFQSEMNTLLVVLEDVDHLAAVAQAALPSHQRSLQAFESSLHQSQKTMLVWQKQIPEMQGIAKDTSGVFRSFASQLPIRIPMIQTDMRKVNFELPDISIKTRDGAIPIPTAEVKMKKYSFEMPDNMEITQREYLKDEKLLLEKSSSQLIALDRALAETAQSMELIRTQLLPEVAGSVGETQRGMHELDAALQSFRGQALPATRADLRGQIMGIEESRDVYKAIQTLIPMFFLTAGLITSGIAIGGAAKLTASSSS